MKESKIFIDDREFEEMIKKEKNNIPLCSLNETEEETIKVIRKIGESAKKRAKTNKIDKDYEENQKKVFKLFGINKNGTQE